MRKRDLFAGMLGALTLLLLGAAATTTLYKGRFAGTYYGLALNVTNASGNSVLFVGDAIPGGVLPAGVLTNYDTRGWTNSGGTIQVTGSSTFLEMLATNGTTGEKGWDFYLADGLKLRHKTDNMASVSTTPLWIKGNIATFGVPVQGPKPWTWYDADTVLWGTENTVVQLTGAHTVTLPGAATNRGAVFTIIAVGSGTNGIYQADGTTVLWTNVATGRSATCFSDGTNWWVGGW